MVSGEFFRLLSVWHQLPVIKLHLFFSSVSQVSVKSIKIRGLGRELFFSCLLIRLDVVGVELVSCRQWGDLWSVVCYIDAETYSGSTVK